jgi:hypothetical protein
MLSCNTDSFGKNVNDCGQYYLAHQQIAELLNYYEQKNGRSITTGHYINNDDAFFL